MEPSGFRKEISHKANVDNFVNGLLKLHDAIVKLSAAPPSDDIVTLMLHPTTFHDVIFKLRMELDLSDVEIMDLPGAIHRGEFRCFGVTVKEKRDASKWTSPPGDPGPILPDRG